VRGDVHSTRKEDRPPVEKGIAMNIRLSVAALLLASAMSVAAIAPSFAQTSPKPMKAKPAATTMKMVYKCSMCPMTFTSAQAKKLKYKCSCCGGALKATKSAAAAPVKKKSA
jgi:hypothetical protein